MRPRLFLLDDSHENYYRHFSPSTFGFSQIDDVVSKVNFSTVKNKTKVYSYEFYGQRTYCVVLLRGNHYGLFGEHFLVWVIESRIVVDRDRV